MKQATRTLARRIVGAIAILVIALVVAAVWYVSDYYHASDAALAIVSDDDGTTDGVSVQELSNGAIAFVPDNPVAGLIFYPGAKVQPEAYAPLLHRCAERRILCVLVKPRFNLAILDIAAADGVQESFPDIHTWVIVGHSMGGVAAAEYAARHLDAFQAIAFLAAYPATDLSGFQGSALSIFGGNDEVLDCTRYKEAATLLPADARELEIAGGNHAYFGDYGEQTGDGMAEITREEQQTVTADALAGLAIDALRSGGDGRTS